MCISYPSGLTKASSRRKGLLGLTAPEGKKSISVTVRRCGRWQDAAWDSWELASQAASSTQRGNLVCLLALGATKSVPTDLLPQLKPPLLNLPKQLHRLGTSFKSATSCLYENQPPAVEHWSHYPPQFSGSLFSAYERNERMNDFTSLKKTFSL